MARDDNDLSNLFPSKNKHEEETLNMNTTHEHTLPVDIENMSIKDASGSIMEMYERESKKPTKEDSHSRVTFQLRNDLNSKLNKLARNKRGLKGLFINQAIEAMLNGLEDKR